MSVLFYYGPLIRHGDARPTTHGVAPLLKELDQLRSIERLLECSHVAVWPWVKDCRKQVELMKHSAAKIIKPDVTA